MPRIQLDDRIADLIGRPLLYLTEGEKLAALDLLEIEKFQPSSLQIETSKKYWPPGKKKYTNIRNELQPLYSFDVFERQDIRDFRKKDDLIVSFSELDIFVIEFI